MNKVLESMKAAFEELKSIAWDEEGYCLNPDADEAAINLQVAIEEMEKTEPIGWRVVIASSTGYCSRWVHYYDYNSASCPLNNDGTWKEGHPHHWQFNDSPSKKLKLESVKKVYSSPQLNGELVATKLGSDPFDEREGPWFSLEDCQKLNKLPEGTKLYTEL